MAETLDDRGFYARISVVMAACTLILTFSFLGILALVSGEVESPTARLPWYLVLGAIAFVAGIVILEGYGASGSEIIITSVVVAFWTFVFSSLTVEGVIYTITHPEEVFVSQLVLYFLAAGLLGTGIAYWGLNHWREFTGQARSL